MNREMYDLACQYKQVFTEFEAGKAVYKDLHKAYMKASSFHIEPHAMAFLEGHRDVILRIDRLVELASKPLDEAMEEIEEDERDERDSRNRDDDYFGTSGTSRHNTSYL